MPAFGKLRTLLIAVPFVWVNVFGSAGVLVHASRANCSINSMTATFDRLAAALCHRSSSQV